MKWREFFLYFWWDLVFLHYDLNELTASFACWFLVAKNISYCQYWKIEYISLDDIGADGRIFGSGISFNNTSLSDIGDQISRWLSTHFWWQIWQTFFCSANVVLVAGLLGVLYYLTFSGDSGAVNYSVKNKEAVTLILDCTQGARSNETLQDLTITYHCCRFVIVIVINVCPNPNCNYHQCRFQLLWKSLQASTIRDSTDGRGSRWAHQVPQEASRGTRLWISRILTFDNHQSCFSGFPHITTLSTATITKISTSSWKTTLRAEVSSPVSPQLTNVVFLGTLSQEHLDLQICIVHTYVDSQSQCCQRNNTSVLEGQTMGIKEMAFHHCRYGELRFILYGPFIKISN